MKVTPIEIRQKSFEKVFRGYDKDEVQAFLNSLSHEWERMQEELKEAKYKLEASEKEVEKLRQVESSLYKTLKTAEDTGANLVEQANKAAELRMKETQLNSDQVLQKANYKAQEIIDDAEKMRKELIEEMMEGLKDLKNEYQRLDNMKQDLMLELKNVSNDVLEKVEKFKNKRIFDAEAHWKKAKEFVRELENDLQNDENAISKVPVKETTPPPKEDRSKATSERDKSNRSFFDEIE